VPGLPGLPYLRSDMGRYVGFAWNAGVQEIFTSYNGSVTWFAFTGTPPTLVGVNPCGAFIARNAYASPVTGYLYHRTGITVGSTCDVPQVILAADRRK
jgi:hypothetical protein